MSKPVVGELLTFTKVDTKPGAWPEYQFQLDDNADYNVAIPPDKGYTPSKGDRVVLFLRKDGKSYIFNKIDEERSDSRPSSTSGS